MASSSATFEVFPLPDEPLFSFRDRLMPVNPFQGEVVSYRTNDTNPNLIGNRSNRDGRNNFSLFSTGLSGIGTNRPVMDIGLNVETEIRESNLNFPFFGSNLMTSLVDINKRNSKYKV